MGSEKPPARRSSGKAVRHVAGEGDASPPSAVPRSKTLHHFPAPPAQEITGGHPVTVPQPVGPRPDTKYSMVPAPEITESATKTQSSNPPPGEPSRKELKETVKRLSQHNMRLSTQMLFLSSVLESTSDAMIVADHDGRISVFNSGACDLFQITADDARDDNLFRMLADNAPEGKRIGDMLMRNQSIVNLRTEVVGFQGRRVPVLLTLNFIKESGEKPSIVAVLKDNSEVEALTRTDPLTGIANRREFDRKVADEHARMKRGHVDALSLLFLDVDHFGDFNKKYGHQVGDEVLRKVGAVLRKTVRTIDTPARYGGEEFVVILPGTDEQGAWQLAERVRRVLAAISVHVDGIGDLRVTASIGVSTHRQRDGEVSEIISEANQAMLVAKRTGRNRTCSYREHAA